MVRTRFAPSPTGYMHIGNLRTALYAYLIAKKSDGKFLLRIEDTDQKRTVDDSVEVIYSSLALAGIEYDEGPDKDGGFGPYIQSERRNIYKKHIEELISSGKAFRCFCTKEELEKEREDFSKKYPAKPFRDKCRDLSAAEIDENLSSGKPFIVRQRIPETGTTTFNDMVFGSITVENNTLDEQVLMKADGLPTYNFANVIDDHLMEITHVVRGYEYLSSAHKYNLLYESFGWDIPQYIHLPHILREDGKKLSKREGDASFQDLLDLGYLPSAIINYIAMLGWNPGTEEEFFTMHDLISKFTPERINKSNAIFSMAKLTWLNNLHIKAMDFEAFHKKASDHYTAELKEMLDTKKISKLIMERLETFNQIPEKTDFFIEVPYIDPALYDNKKMKSDPVSAKIMLDKMIPYIEKVETWNNETVFAAFQELISAEGCKAGTVLWPARIALSGKQSTPGGASEIAYIIGKNETLKRIRDAIKHLS
ncbi:MAG TPA: glutamate--tRNA ligase [Clostridiales bacterium]|nr:glutamate--tRNA ligase [Clostridiales bacterium]HQP70506.1 glutamate--tRNA ligase [Clostridiales bacterium]